MTTPSGMWVSTDRKGRAATSAWVTFKCGCKLEVGQGNPVMEIKCPHGNFMKGIER